MDYFFFLLRIARARRLPPTRIRTWGSGTLRLNEAFPLFPGLGTFIAFLFGVELSAGEEKDVEAIA